MSEATAEPTPEPEDTEKVEQATDYMILTKSEPDAEGKESNLWEVSAKVTARSAKAAIRSWIDQGPDEPKGTYVAVPARSWQPVTVSTETQKKIKLS